MLIAEHSTKQYTHGGTQQDEYADDDVVTVPCPYCTDTDHDVLYTEHRVIGIRRCHRCGLIYTSPRLKAPEAVYWGDADLYHAEARLIFAGQAAHHRDPNYLAELRHIERHRRPGRILDVGCNMGMLLRLARARGWDVVGVEPSPTLASLAGKWGFQVYNSFLHELPDTEHGSFDVVALSDVLEHVVDPLAFLRQAAPFLKSDGLLYAKVPNALWSLTKQRLLQTMGRNPAKGLWDSYEHVVHYTDTTLSSMLAASGYRVVQLAIEPPVQTPSWHELVGHYYQYPTPWPIDWKRKLVRALAYRLSLGERMLRGGRVGHLAPNLAAMAVRAG